MSEDTNINITSSGESISSIEYATTSKGLKSYKVKIYHKDPYEAANISEDLSKRADLFCKEHNEGIE